MLRQIARRLLSTAPMILLVSLIVFSMVHVMPGDAAWGLAGENATPEEVEQTRARLGLDRPLLVQYWTWITGVFRGDLGTSLYNSRSVSSEIWSRLPVTASLAGAALFFAILVSVPTGIVSAVRRGRPIDRVSMMGSSVGLSMPNFWLGMILISAFSLNRNWLPATGYTPPSQDLVGWARGLILPGITLGTTAAAELSRQLRGSLIGVFEQDYIRTARSKGLRSTRVVGKHALKNAATTTVTVMGMRAASLLGGTVVVEQVFLIPGLGTLAVRAVFQRDLPMLQGVALTTAMIVMLMNLLVDVSYSYFNPRVRAG